MKDDNEKEPEDQYPPEFEYLNDIISEKNWQVQQLNKQIASIPKTPPDTRLFRFDPPGMSKAQQDTRNMRSLGSLEHTRDSLQKDIKDRVEAEIKGVDPEIADQIRKVTDEKTNPNPFKGQSDQQLDKSKALPKDLDHSQSFMLVRMKNLRDGKQTPSVPTPTITEGSQQKTPENPNYASERFSKSLSYNVTVGFSVEAPGGTSGPSRNKSGPDMEK